MKAAALKNAGAWRENHEYDAVRNAHTGLNTTELHRPVKIDGRDAKVDGIYLQILVHANEHMGQLIAYARMNGIAPPWRTRSNSDPFPSTARAALRGNKV